MFQISVRGRCHIWSAFYMQMITVYGYVMYVASPPSSCLRISMGYFTVCEFVPGTNLVYSNFILFLLCSRFRRK